MEENSIKESLDRLERKLSSVETKLDDLKTEFEEGGEGTGCFTYFVAALAAGAVLIWLFR